VEFDCQGERRVTLLNVAAIRSRLVLPGRQIVLIASARGRALGPRACLIMHGTTQTIHPERGFGFIQAISGQHILVHRRMLTSPALFPMLRKGMLLNFIVRHGTVR